jgi:thiosulfate/3-mercaptopyruvate sulfurtransferase
MSRWLIETDELAALMVSEAGADRVILDCSWYLPDTGKHARDDYVAGHIPGARFIDLGEISDPHSPYVNMMPTAELFATDVSKLGIGNETDVIVCGGCSAALAMNACAFSMAAGASGRPRVAMWKRDGQHLHR